MKRHFLVSYAFGVSGKGEAIFTTSGGFLNRQFVVSYIRKSPDIADDDIITIVSIYEFKSSEEYAMWNLKQ